MSRIAIILLVISTALISAKSNVEPLREYAMPVVDRNCTFKGKKLYGKIKVVESFPDIKVKVVTDFPDLKVKIVSDFPTSCGKWKYVESFPDLKIQFVESFPDIKVKFVESFEGLP